MPDRLSGTFSPSVGPSCNGRTYLRLSPLRHRQRCRWSRAVSRFGHDGTPDRVSTFITALTIGGKSSLFCCRTWLWIFTFPCGVDSGVDGEECPLANRTLHPDCSGDRQNAPAALFMWRRLSCARKTTVNRLELRDHGHPVRIGWLNHVPGPPVPNDTPDTGAITRE